MSVLTLRGKTIDWSKPPLPTTRVMWSGKTTGGKAVTGSLRTIAWLDHVNTLSIARFGKSISVIQGPYNTGVAASAGTHDYDACLDVWIVGVDPLEQQSFFRRNGGGAYWRRPPLFSSHIHVFVLPPREGKDVSDDYREGGFTVGLYVDGGWSTKGARVSSSQIADYYDERDALATHAKDPTWFPPNKAATVFDLDGWISHQKKAKPASRVLGVSWNLKANRAPGVVRKELTTLLKQNGKPPFAVTLESRSYRVVIRLIATALKYRVYQPVGKAPKGQVNESGSTALLVRRNVKVREHGVLRMKTTWNGPKHGLLHQGRVLPWVVALIDGVPTLVIAVHMPTERANGNLSAWTETIAHIEALASSKRLPFIIIGDWNCPWAASDKASPRALANRLRGEVEHTETPVDYALVDGHNVTVTLAAQRGSDHHAIRVTNKKG